MRFYFGRKYEEDSIVTFCQGCCDFLSRLSHFALIGSADALPISCVRCAR